MHELKHSKYKPTFKYKALWQKLLNSLPPSVSNFAAMVSLKKGTNTCTSIEKDYIYVDS